MGNTVREISTTQQYVIISKFILIFIFSVYSGHDSAYGNYSLMNSETKEILTVELVQVAIFNALCHIHIEYVVSWYVLAL